MSLVAIETIFKKEQVSISDKMKLVLKLSIPGILAQLTSIAMQYIDTAMVGKLGANAMASIGLISTTTWLIGGVCVGISSGFSVQVAHLIGAGKQEEARNVLRQSLIFVTIFGLLLMGISLAITKQLPIWLGAEEAIQRDASLYFLVYALSIPIIVLRNLAASMLTCSGNMKVPSILESSLCLLDVIFNLIFIFPAGTVAIGGIHLTIPGFGLGVLGASIGTALSNVVIALIMVYYVCFCSKELKIRGGGSWKFKSDTIKKACKISIPMMFDHIFMCSAYVASTYIIAPLGSIAIAANSLAITAESLCYMPGYGIGTSATTLVGQSIGADRKEYAKSFAYISTALGVIFMGLMAVVMYALAPPIFALLTTDRAVAALGTKVIRIELFAEPFYGASIVCAGAFRGAGDTFLPSVLNLVSMWGVRIALSAILVPMYGLSGYWIAMTIELFVRGLLFLIRLVRGKWLYAAKV